MPAFEAGTLGDAEIDEITDGELRKADLMPTVGTCRVDIEVFVERHHLNTLASQPIRRIRGPQGSAP
jgi:hypothetical protein